MAGNRNSAERKCSTCAETKPLTLFHSRGKTRPGQFFTKCKSCMHLAASEWRRAHMDRDRTRALRWARANPERHRQAARDWRAGHLKYRREYDRAYARSHPEVIGAKDRNRRARHLSADGRFSSTEWLALVASFGGCCAYCGLSDLPLTADHRVPLARGGSNYISNIVPACRSCNSRKGTRTDSEFVGVAA